MITIETADQKEVRRFRIAQFNGRTATITSGGATITGHVRSVLEKESSHPPCWTITIIPSLPKAPVPMLSRVAPRFSQFADEDVF
jgi:hypothetical protein